MLQLVIAHNQPKEWEYASYEDKTYQTFELRMNDTEYSTIIKPFNEAGLRIKSLQRVQNPFQLGRFLVRKEQKEFRNEWADKVSKLTH